MKKHFLLAALTAALLVSPYADAASGFSRGSSGSSSSTRQSTSAKSDSKAGYGSYSGFGSSSSKKADTPRVQSFAPTTLPRQVATPPAAEPSPAKSGFGATARSGTGKTVASIATASALGGAMYSASANHDAVTAYEAKQKAAAAQAAPPVATASAQDSSHSQPATTQATSSYQPRQQPQVIVVQQSSPQYHGGSMLNDVFWYERGRAAARRDERERDYQRDRDYQYAQAQAQAAQAQTAQAGYAPSVQPVAPSVAQAAAPATTQTSAPVLKAAPVDASSHTSHTGLILLVVFLLAAIGLVTFLLLRDKKTGKPAKKANYTL